MFKGYLCQGYVIGDACLSVIRSVCWQDFCKSNLSLSLKFGVMTGPTNGKEPYLVLEGLQSRADFHDISWLFAMYISPVGNVVAAHSLLYHQYADDIRSCTCPFDLMLTVSSQRFRGVLRTSRAGSWKTGCFSTHPRRRQFCSALGSSVKRSKRPTAST